MREWIERNLGPAGRIEGAAENVMALGRFFGQVPGLLARGAAILDQVDAVTRNGLVLAPETVADIGRAEARRSRGTAIALWVIAALLTYIVYLIK